MRGGPCKKFWLMFPILHVSSYDTGKSQIFSHYLSPSPIIILIVIILQTGNWSGGRSSEADLPHRIYPPITIIPTMALFKSYNL